MHTTSSTASSGKSGIIVAIVSLALLGVAVGLMATPLEFGRVVGISLAALSVALVTLWGPINHGFKSRARARHREAVKRSAKSYSEQARTFRHDARRNAELRHKEVEAENNEGERLVFISASTGEKSVVTGKTFRKVGSSPVTVWASTAERNTPGRLLAEQLEELTRYLGDSTATSDTENSKK